MPGQVVNLLRGQGSVHHRLLPSSVTVDRTVKRQFQHPSFSPKGKYVALAEMHFKENAGIVRVDVRSGVDAASHAEEVQAFVVVASYAAHPREAYITLREEGASDVLASRRVLLQPGEKVPLVLSVRPTPGDYR